MDKLKELCLGHIEYQTRRCRECKIDAFNKRCRYYEPTYLEDYEIMEKEIMPEKKLEYENYGLSCEDCDDE